MSKITWRSEPVKVENFSDELWVGVKGQSNLEIAGSPRNSFRASLLIKSRGGRALDRLGGLPAYQPEPNSECHRLVSEESVYEG